MSIDSNTDLVVRQESSPVMYDEITDTSAVIPSKQLSRVMSKVRQDLEDKCGYDQGISSYQPIHLFQLEELDCNDRIREMLLSVYSNKTEPVSEHWNEEIILLGAVIWEILPYTKKVVNPNDTPVVMPGFYQVRLLTNLVDKNGNYIVLSSSSMGIAIAVHYLIKAQGAWKFDIPQTVRFTTGRGGMHQMVKSGESLAMLKDFFEGKEKS